LELAQGGGAALFSFDLTGELPGPYSGVQIHLDIDPSHGLAREFLAGSFLALGDFDRHMAENVKHAQAHGISAEALAPLEKAYADGGRAGVVRLSLQHAASHPGAMPEIQLALLHSAIGEVDEALPHLTRALDARDPCLVDLAVAPQWDALRAHPEFEARLERMRLRGPKPKNNGPVGGTNRAV
jgi:hypothetical protein